MCDGCKCREEEVVVENQTKKYPILVDIGAEETIVIAKIIRIGKVAMQANNNGNKFGFMIFFEGNPNPCNAFIYLNNKDAVDARANLIESVKSFYEGAYNGRS